MHFVLDAANHRTYFGYLKINHLPIIGNNFLLYPCKQLFVFCPYFGLLGKNYLSMSCWGWHVSRFSSLLKVREVKYIFYV